MSKRTPLSEFGSVSRRRFLAGSSAADGLMLTGCPLRTRAEGRLKIGVLLPRPGYLPLIGHDCQ